MNALAESLIFGLPESTDRMTGFQHGQWLLAQLLKWHRRENKSFWWRYFYLVYELTNAERREEPDALAELTLESRWADPAPGTRSTIYRFRFPPQDHAIRPGANPRDPETEKTVGTVFHIDDAQGVIDNRCGNNRPAPNALSLIPFDFFDPKPKQESLQRLAH